MLRDKGDICSPSWVSYISSVLNRSIHIASRPELGIILKNASKVVLVLPSLISKRRMLIYLDQWGCMFLDFLFSCPPPLFSLISRVWFHNAKGAEIGKSSKIRVSWFLLLDACGEASTSRLDGKRSLWAPRTPMGSDWSPEARSASSSSLTGKVMSLTGSSLIFTGFVSSVAFSGLTILSYSSDSCLLICWQARVNFSKEC